MPQCHSKVSDIGASNNKPSVMIYLQECILSEFPIIMEKWSGYVVVPFREIMTSHIEAISQSEFISIFKCTQKIYKVIIFFRLFQSLVTSKSRLFWRLVWLDDIYAFFWVYLDAYLDCLWVFLDTHARHKVNLFAICYRLIRIFVRVKLNAYEK